MLPPLKVDSTGLAVFIQPMIDLTQIFPLIYSEPISFYIFSYIFCKKTTLIDVFRFSDRSQLDSFKIDRMI